MSDIQLGEEFFRTETAVQFLLSSITQYLEDTAHEMWSSKPDPFKIYRSIHLAHDNIRALEGLVLLAMERGIHIEEGSLQTVRQMHDRIHSLLDETHSFLLITLDEWVGAGKPMEELRELARITNVSKDGLDNLIISHVNKLKRAKTIGPSNNRLN
jgi:hypothetical protein